MTDAPGFKAATITTKVEKYVDNGPSVIGPMYTYPTDTVFLQMVTPPYLIAVMTGTQTTAAVLTGSAGKAN